MKSKVQLQESLPNCTLQLEIPYLSENLYLESIAMLPNLKVLPLKLQNKRKLPNQLRLHPNQLKLKLHLPRKPNSKLPRLINQNKALLLPLLLFSVEKGRRPESLCLVSDKE